MVGSAGAELSERARLFVALDLDDDVRRSLARWRDGIISAHPGVRPIAMDGLHVTLCFLGSCAVEDVDAIAAACVSDSATPIESLRLGKALWLPQRRPRVLAVAVEDETGALARVQSAVADALSVGGWYRREARPFLAHVTVARVAKDRRLRDVASPPPPPPPSLRLREAATLTLFRSHLSPGGSRYEALRVIPLGP